MKVDGYEFKCTQCGDCCKWNGYVFLSDGDIQRLRDKEGLSLNNFLERFTKDIMFEGEIRKVLADKKGTNDCIYLKDNKCSVYDIKPKQCSDYPLKYDEKCEGFNTGEKVMKSKYEDAVKRVSQKLAGDTREKSVIASLFENLKENSSIATVMSKAIESGMDVYLRDDKIKIANLADLYAFTRVNDNHLVHKATKDLWSLEANEDGSIVISRLFDDSGSPVRS